jgi:hypothetical protein
MTCILTVFLLVLTEVCMKGYLKECCNVLFIPACQPVLNAFMLIFISPSLRTAIMVLSDKYIHLDVRC